MARFSDIQGGITSRKSVKLPLPGTRLDPATGLWDGDTLTIDVRVLLPGELALAEERAIAYATGKGGIPKEGERLYDIAIAVYTVHASALDAAEPVVEVPFFDCSPDELFLDKRRRLHLDTIAYLYEEQQLWQAQVSPRAGFVTPTELLEVVRKIGGNSEEAAFFFTRLRPAARLICLHTMACLLADSLDPKSSSFSTSATSGTPASPKRPTKSANSAAKKHGGRGARR